MGDEPDGVRANGAGENVVGAEGGDGGNGVCPVAKGEDDDVALDGVQVDLDGGQGGDGFGEETGVAVILVEARGHPLERDKAGGGEDAGLAHAAAECFANGAGAVDVAL